MNKPTNLLKTLGKAWTLQWTEKGYYDNLNVKIIKDFNYHLILLAVFCITHKIL